MHFHTRCVRAQVLAVATMVLALAAPRSGATPVLSQVNDFESGNTQGWGNGGGAPDPVNVTTGGPGGAADNFLRVTARGGNGAGSRLVAYNRATQWAGNYVTARVTGVEMDLKNFGTTPLQMRIAFQESGPGSRFASAVPFTLPADGLWHHANFSLVPTSLTRASGSSTAATALTRVFELRIIHSVAADFMGDPIASSFGVDNIRPVPEPAVAGMGLAAAALFRRRRR